MYLLKRLKCCLIKPLFSILSLYRLHERYNSDANKMYYYLISYFWKILVLWYLVWSIISIFLYNYCQYVSILVLACSSNTGWSHRAFSMAAQTFSVFHYLTLQSGVKLRFTRYKWVATQWTWDMDVYLCPLGNPAVLQSWPLTTLSCTDVCAAVDCYITADWTVSGKLLSHL